MLRGEKCWTRGKERTSSARTKKLYEMLEKMTCEIDRVQRNYTDPRANPYLRRSATNVLRQGDKPNLREEAEVARSVIFPDRKARTKSAGTCLRNVDSEIIGKNMARVRFDEAAEFDAEKLLRPKYTAKKRSIHTDTHEHGIANDVRSAHTIASNSYNEKRDRAVTDTAKPTFTSGSKTRARIRSSIEEYLQHYSDNIHRPRGIAEEEEECSREVKLSASDIADILASHNIGPHVLYKNFQGCGDDYDSGDCTSENDEDRACSNTAANATQVTSVETARENRKTRDYTSFGNTELYNETRLTKAVDARSFDTRRQSSVTNCQDNALIKMGLDKDLPRDTLSQILQSEYLRKDLSL
ncbi:PREDICTED: uncharacterized protein LOC105561686 [Vollenhovia emeryi]|uniref:uncharacterized protein LOC105561686 n=1 Tax=Vollenhovia emeryi TaxID=411798 RepID=UPI0005F401C7|nr:PREDICTED: uncharacterized protein LOC105561686 [Vollenhovia emeryi]